MTGTTPPYIQLSGEYSEETFSVSGSYPGDIGNQSPLALSSLIASIWGLSAPSFGDDVTIAEFSLTMEPRDRRFELTANDVVIPINDNISITFKEVLIQGEKPNGHFSGRMALSLDISERVGLVFEVIRPPTASTDITWLIEGGLDNEKSTPTLHEFVTAFIGDRWANNLPDTLREITLTELYGKLEDTATTRSTMFRGGIEWRKASTIGTLVISGLVELEVTTDPNGNSIQKGFIEGALDIDTENSLVENLSIDAKATFELKEDHSKSVIDEIEMTIGISEAFQLTTTYIVDTKKLLISFARETPPSLTFGDMLTFIMKLADPYVESYRLDPPWDELNDTNLLGFLSDISLEFDFAEKTVTLNIDYSTNPKSYFDALKVEKISLTAKQKAKPKGRRKYDVTIDFTGNFMGMSVGPGRGQQLSWNVQDDSPASSPGKGASVFELYYLLIGQRVAFKTGDSSNDVHTLTTMTAIDERMVDIVDTISTGEIGDGIVFSRESKWMIASHFMVMETVDAILIFNDPFLYGARVRVLGERAGKLEGLIFEILYRKINENLGVYHTELTLPNAMRNMRMGKVKITLPTFILDIYTNGDFYFDAGFPHNGDFSRSAVVEYGYFTGWGGFYIGKFSGENTGGYVPAIINGAFDPIIIFGLGLKVTFARGFSKGPLSAEISVTFQGIFEGVLAWFKPENPNQPTDTYYKIEASLQILGRLYGKVDFAVISVSVEVAITASAEAVIECYMPTTILIAATVSVRAELKVLFITIEFEFDMSVSESFTIGEREPTPWIVAGGGSVRELQVLAGDDVTEAQLVSLNAAAPDWNRDFGVWSGAVQGLDIIVQPDYTLGLVDDVVSQKDETDHSEIKGVALLFIENDPDVPETRDFSLLTQAVVAWMVYAFQPDFAPTDSSHTFRTHAAFTSTHLRRVYNRLFKVPRHDDDYQAAEIFSPHQLNAFLKKNFTFNFVTKNANNSDISATIFPMLPGMSFSVDRGAMSEGATDEEKAELFADYFRLLGRTALEKLIEVMGEDSDAMTLDYIYAKHFDIRNYAYIAGVVGRFLLHGQRMNDKPLYAQTGQQFSISENIDERKYTLTLTKPDDANWIKLNGNGANTLTYKPTENDLTRLERFAVDWQFDAGADATDPTIDAPVELPYYALVNARFALTDSHDLSRALEEVHTLWKLPNGMQRLLHTLPADSSSDVTIHLPADFDITGITTHYGFVTRLDFKIRRIDGKAGPLPNTYRIVELSATTRDRIERLMDALAENTSWGLHFLVSDAFQSGTCSILRTNLAAAGAPGQITDNTDMTVFGERVVSGSANVQAVRNTLKTLWQAGNIGGEGFYLHYQDASNNRLADDIFDASGAAMVAVIVEDYDAPKAKAAHTDLLYTVRGTSPQSPRSLVVELLDASLQQPTQTLDTGYVGFRILRKRAVVTADPTDPELDVSFQLLTYRTLTDDDGFFKESGASIPTGPTVTTVQQNASRVEKWLYERSFPTTPLVASLPPSSETVFPASENPYAGVGANNAVQVDFDLIDIYGNHTRADAGLNVLPLPVRYTDSVIGLNQYPGLLESYKFASDGRLTYFMRLHAETFINTSQSPYTEWIDRISNARDRYSRVYWQLVQEDVKLLLNCSINKGIWHDITSASKPSFVQYTIESYKFLDALHSCTPEVSNIGDTLGGLARTYRLLLEDLARPNQSLVGLFAAGKAFTVEYTISPKDSISYLRDKIGAAEADILKLPLSEGIITLGGTDYTVSAGNTLTDLSLTDLSTLSDNDLNAKALFVAGTEMPNNYTIDADDTIAYLRKSRNAADADIVALPLKAGTVTLGGTDYTVKDGDTLASLGIKLIAVSPNERDLQGLFQTGASLTLKHTTAEGDSIISIQRALQNRGITPLLLPALLEGLKGIPLKRQITIASHLNAGSSEGFTTLTDSSPIKTDANWAVANQNLMSIIKTGTNIGVVATQKDTLYTLATALGISVAEAMQRVTAKDGWNKGAKVVAVPQPFSGSVQMQTDTDSLPDAFIFPLLTCITVRRDKSLIGEQFSSDDFTNSAGAVNPVVEAYAYLAPHTEESADENADGVSLASFAQDFESAFVGVKLGTSKEKDNQTVSADTENPSTTKPLWGVRLGEGGVTFEIETGDKARFYSMPPLSTRLITDTVSIEGETKSYADVDIDDWAVQFLEAVDAFLEYAAPMYHDDDLRAHVDTVLNAKETLASAISRRVTAIYNDQLQELTDNPDRITAAREAYRQQLMQTLRSAYDIETIVQLDATISEAEALIPAETTDSLAPRMFGQPVVKSNGQQSETAPKFTLSAAKIPLVEPNYLTFFYNTVEPRADELAEHNLMLKIDSLEFNIQPRADMDNMHDSVWLKFVIPLDEYDLEHFAIPIPLRDFPDSPALIYQKAGLDKDAISLDHIREWAYTFAYERGSEAQDSIQTRLDFTGAKADNPSTETEKALFDELAKFLDIAEQNRTLFEELETFINQPDQLKNLNAPAAPNNFETRISTFATRVAAVANAWGNWKPPIGDYTDRDPSYEIEEFEAGEEIHVTLTNLEGAPSDTPLPGMTGYKLDAKDDPNATYTHRFVPDPTDTTPDLGSSLLPDRKLTIDNLDIINHQQAQAEIWILRNDELMEGKKTNPAFVYRTPIIEFSRALVPHLENSIKHNIAEIGSPGEPQIHTLNEHLKAMFEIIIPQEPQQPFGMQLEARYVYALVDLEGVEYDLTATLPAVLGTPLLDLKSDAGAEKYWKELNLYRDHFHAALRNWYINRKPATIGGRWVFTFSIYSGKGDSLPLLKIDYLYLLLEHISDI